MRVSFRTFGQPLTGLGVESGAIRLAHRLKRQCENYRISDQRFKIHVVVVNLEVRRFRIRIREKFLNLDFDRQFDVAEAASALAGRQCVDVDGHEDPLVNGLETHLLGERRALLDGDQTLAPALGEHHLEVVLAHLPGTVHQIAHVDAERRIVRSLPSHDRRFYAEPDREDALALLEEGRHHLRDVRTDIATECGHLPDE